MVSHSCHLYSLVSYHTLCSVALCPLLSVRVAHLFNKSHGAAGSPTTASGSPSTQSRHSSSERSSPVVHSLEDLLPVQQALLYPGARMLVIVTDTSCAVLCRFNKSSSEVCLKVGKNSHLSHQCSLYFCFQCRVWSLLLHQFNRIFCHRALQMLNHRTVDMSKLYISRRDQCDYRLDSSQHFVAK